LKNMLRDRTSGTFAFFSGTTLCYSALFKAGRHNHKKLAAFFRTRRNETAAEENFNVYRR